MSNESSPGITLNISEGALVALAALARDVRDAEVQRYRYETEKDQAHQRARELAEAERAAQLRVERQAQDARVEASRQGLLQFLLRERETQDDFRKQVIVSLLDVFQAYATARLKPEPSSASSESPPPAAHAAAEDNVEDEDAAGFASAAWQTESDAKDDVEE